ncbi:MAG: Flp family type IVb pilin [Solirubrobacteraceae bacterium]
MRNRWIVRLTATLRDEQGQALTEYALMILFVAIATILMLTALGTSVGALLQTVVNGFP